MSRHGSPRRDARPVRAWVLTIGVALFAVAYTLFAIGGTTVAVLAPAFRGRITGTDWYAPDGCFCRSEASNYP